MDRPLWQFLSTDSRFDEVKHQNGTYAAFWMAQGLSAYPLRLRVLAS